MNLDDARMVWDAVRSTWDNADTLTRWALVPGIAAVCLALTPSIADPPRSTRAAADKEPSRPRNTSLWRRLWWRLHPPTDIMRVDGLQIDRTRKPHAAWLGPTGAGKSQSVATVRVDGKRPTLIVTPDTSDPMRAATLRLGGIIWTACESTLPLNFLLGSPTEVAERLTEVFRSGGVGAWKRAARRATASVIRAMDDAGEPRSLQMIGTGLMLAVKADRELRTVCAGWVERFLDLADQFGASIGTEGLDLAELLNQGRTVLLEVDAFDHPSLGMDVVALGLAEARRCAQHVPGGFRLIFEEAGQLADRIDLAEPFFRAGRRRNIATDVLTHVESDLPEALNANTATHIYFAQQLKSAQRIAADRLGLDYRDLDPARIPDFHAYIAHGRIRRFVKFPRPQALPKPSLPSYPTRPSTPSYVSPAAGAAPARIRITELPTPVAGWLALPPPTLRVREILDQIDRSGHCHLWLGGKDRDGYGITRWNGNSRGVHRVVWELTYGSLPTHNEEGERLEIDHTCRVRHCCNPAHLELVTKSSNSKRRWRVRGIGKSA